MAKKKKTQSEEVLDVEEVTPGPGPDIEDQMTPAETLVGVVLRPKATFERMRNAEVGHWWVVAALAVVALTLVTIAGVPIAAESANSTNESQMEEITTTQELSEEEQAQIEQMQRIMSSQAVLGALIGCFSVFGLAIGYLVRAGFTFLLGLALGGRASFKQVWRMSVWTTLPEVLRAIVSAVVTFVTGNPSVSGLSYILKGVEVSTYPYLATLLGSIDIYAIWSLVLLGIGLFATSQLSRGKSAVVALAYWLLTVAFSLGLTAIGQASLSILGMG
ncbi:MAG: YIP1 family protein [Anaerolineae bacterium]|nr:YIP1 family protein [Anaerolineae bacterium]